MTVAIDRRSEARINESLGAIIEQEITQADGAEGNELRGHQEEAMEYYKGHRPAVREADESDAVSTDLRDMVTAVIAQLTPMIANDALVQFEPRGDEDEDAARMEAKALNRVIMDQERGYTKMQGCIKDAALARNCFAKVWWEETEIVEMRELRVEEGTTASQIVAALNDDRNTTAELVEQMDDGVIKVKLTNTSRRFRWRPVDPRRFYYAQGWDEFDLQNIRFCAERYLKSRSDLVAEGYSKSVVDELPKSTKEAEHTAVREQDMDGTMLQDQPKTHDQELVDIYYCYLMVDLDGDGIAERYEMTVADKKHVLSYEECEVVPYVAGTLIIRSNRMQGEDLHDHLKQIQDNKTAALRRWLDNTRGATFSRLGVMKGSVNPRAEDARNGQFIWTEGPPAEAIMGVPVVDVGPSLESLLNYLDKQRTEAGGAALDMQTSQANIAGETWRGISEQYTVKEQLAAMFAKNLAETLIRGIYLVMHQLMRTHAIDPIGVRMRDQWVNVQPNQWPARHEITVLPGLTPRARMAITQALGQGLQFSQLALQLGLDGELVDPDSLYRTITDLYRASGIESPEQYWVDPASEKAQQRRQQKQKSQQAVEQGKLRMLHMQLKSLEMEHQVAARNKSIDARVELYQADLKAMTDLVKAMISEEGKVDERQISLAVERARAAIDSQGQEGTGQAPNGEA